MVFKVFDVKPLEFDNDQGQHVVLYRHTVLADDNGNRLFAIYNSRVPFEVNSLLKDEVYVDNNNKLKVRLVKA